MTTQEQLNAAGTDALALTSFMTSSAGTPTLNSAGMDIGTLADLKGEVGVTQFTNVETLKLSEKAFETGRLVSALSEGAVYRVVDESVEPHLTTSGGARLVHVDGPYVIAITGQSNAVGSNADGPNPASDLVKVWDGVTENWGSSDRTQTPLSRANPDGTSGNNNYALARAHRVAQDTGRPVFIVFDARGGQELNQWVGSGIDSPQYSALATKITNALASPVFVQAGVSGIDELIFAQGEADFNDDFATYLAKLDTFRRQIRAETWCGDATPIYMMAPSDLHDRYQWRDAMAHLCSRVDNRCIFVSSNGLRTEFSQTGTGDNTHFLGESLWEAGFTRIADASAGETVPTCFYGRGVGPVDATDETAMTTFRTLVSRDSWTTEVPPNGPAATGSISWGFKCVSDGNYTFALGYECTTSNAANYGIVAGRLIDATDAADYFAGFGYQCTLSARFTLASGRGHIATDEGGTLLGMYSEYTTPQTDEAMLQVGIGGSTSSRANGLTVRKSGRVEMKSLPVHDDQQSATLAGLTPGCLYATSTGDLKIVV